MYSTIYRVVFSLDVSLVALVMGFTAFVGASYLRSYLKEQDRALRYRYLHVVFLGGSICYLFFLATISFFLMGRSDPTIFFYPPGLILMVVGLWALYQSGRSSRRKRKRTLDVGELGHSATPGR